MGTPTTTTEHEVVNTVLLCDGLRTLLGGVGSGTLPNPQAEPKRCLPPGRAITAPYHLTGTDKR